MTAGITRLRGILREARNVVRLVGLSGVGKTRLVEALFDPRIGDAPLDQALALYANMSDTPDPQPTGMVSDLIAANTRAIVIIDNCSPELHRVLSEVCRRPGSAVSIITVEYDIQEDQPEGTEVFELQPSSESLVEQLIRRRFPDLSQPDVHTVAEFSGGNSRVAIALASTAVRNESLSGLADRELFQRLFYQRQTPDRGLLRAAEACAVVYSFQGEALTGSNAELPRLGAMVGIDAAALFGYVTELRKRDLVQQRGVWRAVLPHAIANRLAAMALEEIPFEIIERELINGGSARLLKSFSRRLGYLDASPHAQAIVCGWLAEGGLLGNLAGLDEVGRAMLGNIAPVAPQEILVALERGLDAADGTVPIWAPSTTGLLRSLAWDALFFERSLMLLAEFAPTDNEARQAVKGLFQLYLSGTHAPPSERARVADALLRSADPGRQQVGMMALGAMLEGRHFSAAHNFEFGARSRDYGYWPRQIEEVRAWYEAGFTLAARAVADRLPIADEVRRIVGRRLRGLWTQASLHDMLEEISHALGEGGRWPEGWIGTRDTLRYDYASFTPEIRDRLRRLEQFLRPRTLIDKIRAVVLHDGFAVLEFEDIDLERDDETVEGYQHTDKLARELGRTAAGDPQALAEVLPALLSGRGHHRVLTFGQGLGQASGEPTAIWRMLTAQFAQMPENSRSPLLLLGFVSGLHEHDPPCAAVLLDEAVDDGTLGPFLPVLQSAIPINADGVARLHRALALDHASGAAYNQLAGGRVTDNIPGAQLRALLAAIAGKTGGRKAAAEILGMRLFSDASERRPADQELGQAARDLLLVHPFRHGDRDRDMRLELLMKAALSAPDGPETARAIWRNFTAAVEQGDTYASEQHALLKKLFVSQPTALLDEIGAGDSEHTAKMLQLVRAATRFGDNPIDAVPPDALLAWCQRDPAVRFPLAASMLTPMVGGIDGVAAQWTPAARTLLNDAPNRVAILDQFSKRLMPMSWSGSLVPILEARSELLRDFFEHPEEDLANKARDAYENLRRAIAAERQEETRRDQLRDERFE